MRRNSTSPREPVSDRYRFHGGDWFSRHLPVWENALADYRKKPGIQYLEVGVFEGRSAIWMIDNILMHSSSRATFIDAFNWALPDYPAGNPEPVFLANLRASGAEDRATFIKGRSQVELRALPLDFYDIIYIDGSHTAFHVLEDVVLAWRLLKTGGLLILDDYKWPRERPADLKPEIAIDAFMGCFRRQIDVVHSDYQVLLRKGSLSYGSVTA